LPPASEAQAASSGAGAARILDAGYRRYEGTRLGVAHAVRSVIANTLRRVLGLRRPARSKVLPVMSVVFAYLPAIVFVGVVALFNRFGDQADARALIPEYSDYYGFIISAIVLFVTFVAPEALCPDRRSRVLSLYLASPLTRMTYLGAKAAAVGLVILLVTLGPPLLLLLGLALQSEGPDGFVGFLTVLGRILLSGAMFAALFSAVSMAIASLTDRRAVVAAATLLLIIGSQTVAATWRFGLDGPPEALLLSLTAAPMILVEHIYAEPGALNELSTTALVGGVSAWTLVGAAVAVWKYRSLQVTR
jgi:ABC-2 type transport system permease protein